MLHGVARDAEGGGFCGEVGDVLEVADEFAWLETLLGDLLEGFLLVVVVNDPTPV